MGLFEQYPLVFVVAVAAIGGVAGWVGGWLAAGARVRDRLRG